MMWLTVSQKINLGGAAFAAIVFAIATGVFLGGRSVQSSFEHMKVRAETTALLNALQLNTQKLTKAEGKFIVSHSRDDYFEWNQVFRELLGVVDAVEGRLVHAEPRAALEDFILAQFELKKSFMELHTRIRRSPIAREGADASVAREGYSASLQRSLMLSDVMIEAVQDIVSFNQAQARNESVVASATLSNIEYILVALIALGIVATVALRSFALRTISRPIVKLLRASRTIAKGRFDLELDIQSRDEVGELARSIQTMARELDASYASLEEKVRERTAELARSNGDLEQFAYVASHDLQEPLRTIAGFAQLLAKRYRGKLDDKADVYINHLTQGASRMQELVQDLLTYSRIRTKQKPFQSVDCAALVDKVLLSLRSRIKESEVAVTVEQLPAIYGDRTQLTQLFQNLIGNAIKFRRESDPMIRISAEQQGEKWQFSLQDNGIGIEPRHKSRIFTIFQRLHSREEYEGTGIGLAICKKVVEHHKGELWVESEPGLGSTFYWTVPRLHREDQGAT